MRLGAQPFRALLRASSLRSNKLFPRHHQAALFSVTMAKRDREEEPEVEEGGASKRPRRSTSKAATVPSPKKGAKAASKQEDEEKTVTVGGKAMQVKKMSAAEVKGKKGSVQTTLPFASAGGPAKAKPVPPPSGDGRVVKFGDTELELPASWVSAVGAELDKPYFKSLQSFIESEVAAKKTIFPPLDEAFNALKYCPLDQVKVVVVGQDPYHGPGQAHGLSFSVLPPTPPPPSLNNMFKELEQDPAVDFQRPKPAHGSLEAWAKQGVLMLNAVLTVRQAEPNSHKGKGWEKFTDAVISAVNREQSHVVFFLWGADAKKRGDKLDKTKHKLLVGPHPSPLSAHKGFFGCKHFSLCNEHLKSVGKTPINWQI